MLYIRTQIINGGDTNLKLWKRAGKAENSPATVEAAVLDQTKLDLSRPKYFMLTDKYLENHPEKNRLQRLIQIAMNKNIKVRIVDAQSTAGQRLKQFGGLVFFWTH